MARGILHAAPTSAALLPSMTPTCRTLLVTTVLTLASTAAVRADEYLWLYTRGADTLPQGVWEAKFAMLSRLGKASGNYVFNEFRPELEYGLTDRLTLGAEISIFDHHYSKVRWAPMIDTQGGPDGSFDKTQYAGLELYAKYNILSAYKDPIGLAVGAGYERRDVYRLDGAEIDQDTLELMVFLQKNWLDNTLQWSFSGKVELERRKSPDVLEEEIAFDLATGLSYRVAPRWFVGVEARYQAYFLSPQIDGVIEGRRSSWDIGDMRLGDQFQYGLYAGPTLHYAGNEWWITAGALWQVQGWSADGPDASSNNRDWDEHERWHVGVTVGWEFGRDKGEEPAAATGKTSRSSK